MPHSYKPQFLYLKSLANFIEAFIWRLCQIYSDQILVYIPLLVLQYFVCIKTVSDDKANLMKTAKCAFHHIQ